MTGERGLPDPWRFFGMQKPASAPESRLDGLELDGLGHQYPIFFWLSTMFTNAGVMSICFVASRSSEPAFFIGYCTCPPSGTDKGAARPSGRRRCTHSAVCSVSHLVSGDMRASVGQLVVDGGRYKGIAGAAGGRVAVGETARIVLDPLIQLVRRCRRDFPRFPEL